MKLRISRDRALDAVDVLNDLIGDMVTGTNVLREYQNQFHTQAIPRELMVGIQKMCVSHLVMACCKFIEFFDQFHDILNAEDRTRAKALVREFKNRGMVDFRNKVVGHIWDNKKSRPLALSEIIEHLARLTRNDMNIFLNWINKLQTDPQPETVVGTVEVIRNRIVESFSISSHEVIDR